MVVSGLYNYMKSVNFPLLRTSPAIGTGNYGALPHAELAIEELDGNYSVGASAPSKMKRASGSSDEDLPEEVFDFDTELEEDSEDENDPADNSPYPEVRASVLATDDETLSINTPRMWTLSLLFTLVGSSTNLLFSLRYPSISITPVIALLLAHPLGKLWDQLFPEYEDDEDEETIKLRSKFSRLRRWLAQGRWNRKEHACVYISSNVSFGFAFATDVRLFLDFLL